MFEKGLEKFFLVSRPSHKVTLLILEFDFFCKKREPFRYLKIKQGDKIKEKWPLCFDINDLSCHDVNKTKSGRFFSRFKRTKFYSFFSYGL